MGMSSPINASFADAALQARRALDATVAILDGVAPPGWNPSVQQMQKTDGIGNPYALAWWMRNRGFTPAKHDAEGDFDACIARALQELSASGIPSDCVAAARGEMWAQAQLLGDGHQMTYQERPWR